MFQRRYQRKSPISAFPKKYVKKYPTRKYPLALKNNQSKYELGQPTARVSRTAMQSQLYQTPLWPASKLIHGQLYYDFQQSIVGTAGIVASRVYTANGVFDPDITGTGHQVIGFDQIMAAYNHYSVIRSKITVTFLNNGDAPVRCGIYLNPDSTPLTDIVRIMENGLIKTVVCDSKTSGTGERLKSVSIDCDCKKFFGKGKYSELLESDYQGTLFANPVEQVYFTVFTGNPFDTTTTTVVYDAVISYDTIYHETRKLPSS